MSTSSTYPLRKQLVEIARRDKGLTEQSKNRAPWIAKLWTATDSPEFYQKGNHVYPNGNPPYCAAGVAFCLREWLSDIKVRSELGLTAELAEAWRCKSPSAFEWLAWARKHGIKTFGPEGILHCGDIVVYSYSHIEIVTDDDGTPTGPFTAIGYNTNAQGSRDGEGCYEKPRSRASVKQFIRIML